MPKLSSVLGQLPGENDMWAALPAEYAQSAWEAQLKAMMLPLEMERTQAATQASREQTAYTKTLREIAGEEQAEKRLRWPQERERLGLDVRTAGLQVGVSEQELIQKEFTTKYLEEDRTTQRAKDESDEKLRQAQISQAQYAIINTIIDNGEEGTWVYGWGVGFMNEPIRTKVRQVTELVRALEWEAHNRAGVPLIDTMTGQLVTREQAAAWREAGEVEKTRLQDESDRKIGRAGIGSPGGEAAPAPQPTPAPAKTATGPSGEPISIYVDPATNEQWIGYFDSATGQFIGKRAASRTNQGLTPSGPAVGYDNLQPGGAGGAAPLGR